MPIILALVILGALAAGVVYSFDLVTARLGEPAAIGMFVVIALVVIALLVHWIQRYRAVLPNTKEGDWTHTCMETWGGIRLSATKGLLWLSLDGAEGTYTLTELQDCAAQNEGERWSVLLKVRGKARAEWKLPMPSQREAKRWARILTLAQAQRL
jgi:uncharacterized membrane protein YuzA (DUF378 family)